MRFCGVLEETLSSHWILAFAKTPKCEMHYRTQERAIMHFAFGRVRRRIALLRTKFIFNLKMDRGAVDNFVR